MPYALQVLPDADHGGQFNWVVLEEHPDGGRQFTAHGAGECGFDSYAAALNAGTLALAVADGQPYENEAADPVGDADGAAQTAVVEGGEIDVDPPGPEPKGAAVMPMGD